MLFNTIWGACCLAYWGVLAADGINLSGGFMLGAFGVSTLTLLARERYVKRLERDNNALTDYAERVSEETDKHMVEFIREYIKENYPNGGDRIEQQREAIDVYWTNGSRHYGYDPIGGE